MNTTSNEYGESMPKVGKEQINQEDRNAMYQRYVKGEIINDIADDYGLTSTEVTDIVEAIGAAATKKDAKAK